MSGARIRAASLADTAAIERIARAAWPVAYASILSPEQLAYMLELMYSEGALRSQIAEKGHRFLLLDDAHGEPLGFAGFAHGHRPRCTRLHKLYVLPKAKGSGHGAALLQAVELAAHDAHDTLLELNVNRFNPTKDWYLRRGFIIVRDEVIDIGHGFVMDDHVMEKPLTSAGH
jgi:GNAT superfamily N-acetyltransferase